MERLMKKLFAGILPLLLLLSSFGTMQVKAEEKDFDEFLTEKWVEMMEADYSTMHFSVKDYKSMGLEKPEISLGKVSSEYFAEAMQEAQESLDQLHAYDFNSLNERQQYDYQVYERNLENTIASYQFADYEELFNPYSGTQSDLTTVFTEFVFYQQEDIDDYLVLLADYPRFMNEMLEFTKQQAAKGYFMTDRALDVELEQLKDLSGKGEESPFIIIFEGRIDEFEGLTDAERKAYKDKNRDIVLNEIFPCVDAAAAELETLRGSRSIGDKSVYYYPEGKEYYNVVLRNKTSDDVTAQEAFDYLGKAVKDSYEFLMDVMMSSEEGEDLQAVITEMTEPTEILDYLRAHMEGFPQGPELTYKASYLDPSVANPSVMAYYLSTPIDDVTENVIRINGTNIENRDMNTLYYTLAHEGFPGHLYQFTWYYSQKDMNPIRHDLNMIGYTEGWAQYVEKIMLNRSPLTHSASEFASMNVFLGYCLQAAADVAVNGLGYDEAKLKKWMGELGFDEAAASEVYVAVADMPGQIVPYGYGMAKFWELRERTQSALGDEFDLEDYHLQLLTNGPRSFDIVESDLKKYVEAKGKTMPEEFKFFYSERTDEMLDSGGLFFKAVKNYKWILVAGVVIVIILLVLLFLLIRGIIRLFTRKRKR